LPLDAPRLTQIKDPGFDRVQPRLVDYFGRNEMFLFLALYAMGGTTLAGVFMVAALTAGYTTATPIIWSAVAGFALALPIVWYVTRRLRG
jgi:hypothetical protein